MVTSLLGSSDCGGFDILILHTKTHIIINKQYKYTKY